jgi:hypothetical protein
MFHENLEVLGGPWTGDETDLMKAVEAAVAAVVARRARHGEGGAALARLADGQDGLVSGAAAARIGHHAFMVECRPTRSLRRSPLRGVLPVTLFSQ